MNELKSKTIGGLAWSSIERVIVQIVQFILGIVLARLLLPTDYGLIGMIAIFFSISQAVIDSGFSQALIQRQNVSETDYSTVYFFNIFAALVLYGLLFILAPLVSNFYEQSALTAIIRVASLTIVFNGLSIIHLTKLTKSLDFKTQTKCSVTAIVISGVIGIYLAYIGYGVWALVAQMISKSFINLVLLMILRSWTPIKIFSKESFLGLFSFGSKLLASGLLNAVYSNLYLIAIGKYFSARELGLYTRANQFQLLPTETLAVILQRVTFPVLSTVQDDNSILLNYYRKFIRLAAFITFPLMIGLMVTAYPFIEVILTLKWIEAAPFLQLLAIAGLLYPIHALNLNLLKVKGRSDLFLKLEIYKKVLITIVLIGTIPFGIQALIIGQVVLSFLFLFVNTYYTKQLISYGVFNQLRDIIPFMVIATLMGVCVYFGMMLVDSALLKFTVALIIGSVSYFVMSALFKMQEIDEIKKLVSNLKLKANS